MALHGESLKDHYIMESSNMKKQYVQFNTEIPIELRKKLRLVAAFKECSVKKLVNTYLEQGLKEDSFKYKL